MFDQRKQARNIYKSILLVSFFIILVPVSWFVYEAYIKDHSITYHSCGGDLPISVPFDVSKRGESLSCDFTVRERGRYTIYLVYLRQNDVRVLSSDYLDRIGKGITLGSKLYGPEGKLIIPVTSGVQKIDSHDSDGFYADILTTTYSAGTYRLDIESLDNAPEVGHIKTELRIMKSISVTK